MAQPPLVEPSVEAQPAAEPADERIAIIGIAGRFPEADDLEEFWKNLAAGRDCIREVPKERWDHDRLFDPRKGVPGRAYAKWGGFLRSIDRFDPLFFNIAPGDAVAMDPQSRLFLEVAYEAMEDAGYRRDRLVPDGERDVGVFAGVMYGEYQFVAVEEHQKGNPVYGAAPYWSIANRVSYHLDLHGPSLAVDTACSASLTALHLACRSLIDGECRLAFAGGVNLNLHPQKFLGLSQGRFASSDGHCRSFGADGDGYVPGEGVGVVLLKPLARALADGDHIHGVILATAVNHGGKTNGYTVPSPNAQGAVIRKALERAGAPAASIGYVEAHGTGTSLGDPIEVTGLVQGFGDGLAAGSIPLGSVKANIGHLEAAAGIAGLAKIVLQFRHGALAPLPTFAPPNPNIDFAATPFVLQTTPAPWPVPPGGHRRAALSSFGAGGANAHVILEDLSDARPAAAHDGPLPILLSARSDAQLAAYAGRLAAFLGSSLLSLTDIAFTLATGREPLEVRVAFAASSREEAAQRLEAIAAGRLEGVLHGRVPEEAAALPEIGRQDLRGLLDAWIGGAEVDWAAILPAARRVSLPPHPFLGRRYWLATTEGEPAQAARLHPFIERIEPSLEGAVFLRRFTADEPMIRDHQVGGRALVPGVVQLEMAHAAALAVGMSAPELADVVWLAPIVVPEEGVTAKLELRRNAERVGFEVLVGDAVVARGAVVEGKGSAPSLLARPVDQRADALPATAIYEQLDRRGIRYGTTMRALARLWPGRATAVADLAELPTDKGSRLAAALDGGFQAMLGLAEGASDATLVPFALGRARWLGDPGEARRVRAVRDEATGSVSVFLLDEGGVTLMAMEGIATRPAARPGTDVTFLRPLWRERPLSEAASAHGSALILHAPGAEAGGGGAARSPRRRRGLRRDDRGRSPGLTGRCRLLPRPPGQLRRGLGPGRRACGAALRRCGAVTGTSRVPDESTTLRYRDRGCGGDRVRRDGGSAPRADRRPRQGAGTRASASGGGPCRPRAGDEPRAHGPASGRGAGRRDAARGGVARRAALGAVAGACRRACGCGPAAAGRRRLPDRGRGRRHRPARGRASDAHATCSYRAHRSTA